MNGNMDVLKRMYDRFNARDIDGVLAALAEGVAWANGMDGGHVHGREAVRDYWMRQWAIVSPRPRRQATAGPSARATGQGGRARIPLSGRQGHPLRHSRRLIGAHQKAVVARGEKQDPPASPPEMAPALLL